MANMTHNHRSNLVIVAKGLSVGLVLILAWALWASWQAGAPERQYRQDAKLQFELCMVAPNADTAACLHEYTATLEAWPTLGK